MALLSAACGGGRAAPRVAAPTHVLLRDETGRDRALAETVGGANLTVLVFFSADCPVQKAHDQALRDLIRAYAPRGVAFDAVVSEVDADVGAAREAVKQRGLPLVVLEDRGAKLADALDVEYSTHTVVIDRSGAVLYSGGIDGGRSHASAPAERWLERALEAALAGKPVAKPRTEPLGCPLRKH